MDFEQKSQTLDGSDPEWTFFFAENVLKDDSEKTDSMETGELAARGPSETC